MDGFVSIWIDLDNSKEILNDKDSLKILSSPATPAFVNEKL